MEALRNDDSPRVLCSYGFSLIARISRLYNAAAFGDHPLKYWCVDLGPDRRESAASTIGRRTKRITRKVGTERAVPTIAHLEKGPQIAQGVYGDVRVQQNRTISKMPLQWPTLGAVASVCNNGIDHHLSLLRWQGN